MNSTKFREELKKIMPGYKWTVHRGQIYSNAYLEATGIQTAGSTRLSTLHVIRVEKNEVVTYMAQSSGFGKRARWLGKSEGGTLARALRRLQKHYETEASNYSSHASCLQAGRGINQ
jgi:hypothetical protein